MLSTRAANDGIQIILSTHSPNIAASAPVENVILVCKGKTFPLRKNETMLDDSDYTYLSRFLDVTKANLFFARGVLIVEGPAEELLLPVLADACGRSFTANGISVVNVGSVGLFRYARSRKQSDRPATQGAASQPFCGIDESDPYGGYSGPCGPGTAGISPTHASRRMGRLGLDVATCERDLVGLARCVSRRSSLLTGYVAEP